MRLFKILAAVAMVCAVHCSVFATTLQPIVPQYVTTDNESEVFVLADNGKAAVLCVDEEDWPGVKRAVSNLKEDLSKVSGAQAQIINEPMDGAVIIGTIGKSKTIDKLIKDGKLDVNGIKGEWESFVIETIDGNLVVAGSDKRGTIYGIYDISEKIGVSPWHYWADAPIKKANSLYVKNGRYVMPSPKVKYRGIFLNDEAPCLTSWVYNTFATNYGGHEFYEKVFDLLLRLKANYLWPAMWGWAFYSDDPKNSELADEMGIVMGTSHHEPMGRNHQEWARHRKDYGEWNYETNQKVIDKFFYEGVERIADKDDIITIGMRGDGDAPMGGKEGHDHEFQSQDQRMLKLLEKIIGNQRKIIKKATGKPASEHPQLWALYKEVQKYYDLGLKVPDDVIILLADDNWGNVRRLPNEKERQRPGGWGMYYHVDYVGAPRNSKWLNVTPIQNLWEQMDLTYEYGVDKLWVLNVGDLKPMEYPITLFLDMAWDPERFNADNLLDHTTDFCGKIFGEENAENAAEILNMYCKYAGRVTPEMLDSKTYNLASGEWKQVCDEFMALETEALRQYLSLSDDQKDAYKQLILFPVQALANLYDMYYSQAMNSKLYAEGNPECNYWADRVEKAFQRDAELMKDYNQVMSGGKWNGMMTQKHIGYTSWNDNFEKDTMPQVDRLPQAQTLGGYVFDGANGAVVMEAEHCYEAKNAQSAEWKVIPNMGRTQSGISLYPRQGGCEDAELVYRMNIPQELDSVTVYVVVKSTLPFERADGHQYAVSLDGGDEVVVNFNGDLNDQKSNPYEKFYPTVARRIVESKMKFPVSKGKGQHELSLKPMDSGIVFEKIVVDYGGYNPAYLYMNESSNKRICNVQ